MAAAGSLVYDPLNQYKPLGPDIGIVDGPLEYFTTAGVRLPLPFSTRMTIVRLENGDLFLHSPIAFDAGLAERLRAIGRVRHLVSPNQFHATTYTRAIRRKWSSKKRTQAGGWRVSGRSLRPFPRRCGARTSCGHCSAGLRGVIAAGSLKLALFIFGVTGYAVMSSAGN
jgi:hypothetical protein